MKIKTWLDKKGDLTMSEIRLDEQDLNYKKRRNITEAEREDLFEIDGRQRLK